MSECWKVKRLGVPKMLSIMSILVVFFVLPVQYEPHALNSTAWLFKASSQQLHLRAWTPLGGLFVGTTPICPERPKKSLFSGLRCSSFCWVSSWYVAWHLNHLFSPVLGATLESLFWGVFLGFMLVTVSEIKSQSLGIKAENCLFP